MSALQEAIPAKYRKPLYAVYALIGVTIGAVQVGFSAAELGQPVWLTVALAVYAFIGGAFGITAASNTYAAAIPASEGGRVILDSELTDATEDDYYDADGEIGTSERP